MDLNKLVKTLGAAAKKHTPEILTGIGVAGLLATTVMAVKATPKALMLIHEKEDDLKVDRLNATETVKAAWKCYIPSAVTGVASVACIIGASSVNAKRNAALATAYTLSETALKEYRSKVIETVGEKKEQTIKDAITKDKLDKHPVDRSEIIVTEKGETLCYDIFTGRYFKSDVDKLKRAVNDLNEQLLNDGSVSLNDFYYLIGLDSVKRGDDLGWDTRKGQVRLEFSSQLASDGTPCLVLDFAVAPIYDYYR